MQSSIMSSEEGDVTPSRVRVRIGGEASEQESRRRRRRANMQQHTDVEKTMEAIVLRSSSTPRRRMPFRRKRKICSQSKSWISPLSYSVLFVALLINDMIPMHTSFVLKQPKSSFGLVGQCNSPSTTGKETLDSSQSTTMDNIVLERTVQIKPEEAKLERLGDRAFVSISLADHNDDAKGDASSENNTDSSGFLASYSSFSSDDEIVSNTGTIVDEKEEKDKDNGGPIAGRQKIVTARDRASLLLQRSSRNRSKMPRRRETSVGPRRSRVQGDTRAATKIMGAIRKTAVVATSADGAEETKEENDDNKNRHQRKSIKVTNSIIQTTIEDLLMKHSCSLSGRGDTAKSKANPPPTTASFSSFAPHVGVLGNIVSDDEETSSLLHPGSVVLGPTPSTNDKTTVRIATPADDVDVASLRLSVFSEFTPDMQNQFHGRSCQAMHSRRLRGAICLVARAPPLESQHKSYKMKDRSSEEDSQRGGVLLGSAECSFHEFFGTRLGLKRPRNSVLYITEVAVNPAARRQGVGYKLLQAIDRVAEMRGTETLYLHVDVANFGAIALYEKAGYRKASLDDAVFMEFTTSLNLQPGATQGRDHFLLYKDLLSAPTWLEEDAVDVPAKCSEKNPLVGTLGFEIPA